MDLDLLEKLLDKVKMLATFKDIINKFKEKVQYGNLTTSSEHDITSIISSLHNVLQSKFQIYCLSSFSKISFETLYRFASFSQDVYNYLLASLWGWRFFQS